MSAADLAPAAERRATSRGLLLVSLALNLFFIGVAFAMLIRAPAPPSWDRNVFVRLERLGATLPPADAAQLHGEVDSHRTALEDAQTQYRAAQDMIRGTLRREPFDIEAMRAAVAKSRAARQNFDQILQGMLTLAASKMSHAGRQALADWPPGRKSSGKP